MMSPHCNNLSKPTAWQKLSPTSILPHQRCILLSTSQFLSPWCHPSNFVHSRMNTCQISYGPTDENNDEEKEIIAIKRTFIPDHRSFQVNSLQRNTSYWLFMTCTDIYGDVYNSSILNFTTGEYKIALWCIYDSIFTIILVFKERKWPQSDFR